MLPQIISVSTGRPTRGCEGELMKTCASCQRDLPTDAFQADAQKEDGLRSWCRECRRVKQRGYVEGWKRQRADEPTPENKRCSKCGYTQLISAFVKDACRPDGYHVWCSGCRKKANKPRATKIAPAKRRAQLLRDYGLTVEAYNDLLVSQHGVCAICGGQPPRGRSFHVDHDHTTGAVRGLLCATCNTGIGGLKDSVDLLRKAADYLIRAAGGGNALVA